MRFSCIIALYFSLFASLAFGENLEGKIWDTKQQAFIAEKQLLNHLKKMRFVLLGEVHDNKSHHDRQAKLLERLIGSGQARAVVFEMVDRSKQNAFAIFRGRFQTPGPDTESVRHDATGLEILLDWKNSGWPNWDWYKPLFDIAMLKNLPLGAGGLSRHDVGAVHKQGLAGLSPDLREILSPWLDIEWPDNLEQRSRREIREGHCNALPENILPAFSLIQRLRDASMSQSLMEQSLKSLDGQAILIAGNGHVRNDMAVPYFLLKRGADSVASVGMLEIRKELQKPSDYARIYDLDGLPFDFVIFTKAAEREDPCAMFKQKSEK
ncbi:ChaN family lipoprotein [Emcibacter sp.]|uniref:ChaN family lipoprotein n=1 Tax=Emcibacter sp. TaxID=1979954 RepID=UPI003A918C18